MDCLPIELQTHILDEIPQFTRLSKTHVAGKNYLDYLSKKNITKAEFIRYIQTYKPNKSFIFIREDNSYSIVELILRDRNYESIKYHFIYKMDNFEFYRISSLNMNVYVLGKYLSDLKCDEVTFDVVTSYNIYTKFRTECLDCRVILFDKFVEFSSRFRTLIGNYPELMIANISTITENIIIYLVVTCNNTMIDNEYPMFPSHILSYIVNHRLSFDETGIYNGDRIGLLKLSNLSERDYSVNLNKIFEYLKQK